MKSEEMRKFLTEKNKLEHRLPEGHWEDYLVSIIKILNSELPTIKKVVRAQKVMRFIYDNEVNKPTTRKG